MARVSCAGIGRHLPAFYDGELQPDVRRLVVRHLATCARCAEEARALELLGDVLRAAASGRPCAEEMAGLAANVVSRLAAERELSLQARVGRLFEDMHLVWAGLAATAGALVCALAIFGMASLGVAGRADSLSGMLSALASPGSNANPVRPGGGVPLPRVSPGQIMPGTLVHYSADEAELLLALSAVVTREGRITGLEVLLANEMDSARLLELVRAAQAARFEPARVAGAPVAVNLVWLVAHTTVRGRAHG